jgi:hypothetical protein
VAQREVRQDRSGETPIGDNQQLSMSYHYHSWSEAESYGDTTVYRPETNISNEEFLLDNRPVLRSELVDRFGAVEVDAAIDRILESG